MIQSENSNTLPVDADHGQNVSGTISNVDVWLTPSDSLDVLGWRPIETAPKDGTIISVWHQMWKCPISARYIEGRKSKCKWVEATMTTEWPDESFTHWMPLPEPPVLP